MMTALCELFKIRHHRSIPYRPKANGLVEDAKKNIKKIIQKMVISLKTNRKPESLQANPRTLPLKKKSQRTVPAGVPLEIGKTISERSVVLGGGKPFSVSERLEKP
ncbi:hypothetical protein CR513_26231, partial [Mucuna pruriens]